MTGWNSVLPITAGSSYTTGGTIYVPGAGDRSGWHVYLYLDDLPRPILHAFDKSADIATQRAWSMLDESVDTAGGQDAYLKMTLRQIEQQLIKDIEHAEFMVANERQELDDMRARAMHNDNQVQGMVRGYVLGVLDRFVQDLAGQRKQLDDFRAQYAEYLVSDMSPA